MKQSQSISLRIAVLTFHRPDPLRTTIKSLIAQLAALPDDIAGKFHSKILVIDNADKPEAQQITELNPNLIQYSHEPRPGISAARNRALSEARNDQLLLFVDDDIVPLDGWLESMLRLWEQTRCEGILGYVESTFEESPDPWIIAGQFFHRPQKATGTVLPAAASNNLLLDLEFVRSSQLIFNESLGLVGGEDSLFTREMVANGARILWCNEAKAIDPVPVDRATRRWVCKRAFRVGNSESIVNIYMATRSRVLLVRCHQFFGGFARFLLGSCQRIVGRFTSQTTLDARGARMANRGAGHVVGALGLAYFEYDRGRPQIRRVALGKKLEVAS